MRGAKNLPDRECSPRFRMMAEKTWPVRRLLTDGQTRTFNGQAWTKIFTMDATHAEPKGYLAAIQAPDGMIELISSGVHYRFNVAWLQQTPAVDAVPQGDKPPR